MSTSAPEVSLIVCTRNRAPALGRCLDAIARADHQSVEAELIVVDNGSTDGTAGLIEGFAETTPLSVRLVLQPRIGLSNARNSGLEAAKGRLVAFTDDDCYVAEDYFSELADSYRTGAFDYSGGRVFMYDPSAAWCAGTEQTAFELIPPHSFIAAGRVQGANIMMRRAVYERVGPFDPALGAGTRFRCEDVDYIARAADAGFTGAHLPNVVVLHDHGRKPGAEMRGLNQANDFARGAYYGKRFALGDRRAAYYWVRQLFACPQPPACILRRIRRFPREVRGAFAYLRQLSVK